MKWWVRIYDDGTGEVSQDGEDRPAPRPGKVVRVAESYDTAAEARKALDDYLREIQEGGPIIESRQVMTTKKRRGLAAMDPEQQRAIASLGGQAVHDRGTGHEFTREEARQAGKKGGWVLSRDRTHMLQIGRKGGIARQRKRAEEEKGK